MKFAIYHQEREYAREMGDPKLAEVEAPSREEAERLTAHLGLTGTIAVPLSPVASLGTLFLGIKPHTPSTVEPSPDAPSNPDTEGPKPE